MKEYYDAIQAFHDKNDFKGTNNEEMTFRLNLMIEELGELAQAITKGKTRANVIEENIDILNLVLGNFISLGVSVQEVDDAFWVKHKRIMDRTKKKLDNGNYRVSDF